MANWEELKPLRIHRSFMTFVVLGLLIFLVFAPKHSLRQLTKQHLLRQFVNHAEGKSKARVISNVGLKIRERPRTNSSVLITVPYGCELTIVDRDSETYLKNGKVGKWYKVEYQGVEGYVTNRFIEE